MYIVAALCEFELVMAFFFFMPRGWRKEIIAACFIVASSALPKLFHSLCCCKVCAAHNRLEETGTVLFRGYS